MLTTTQTSVESAERPTWPTWLGTNIKAEERIILFSLLVIRKHQSLEFLHSGEKRGGK